MQARKEYHEKLEVFKKNASHFTNRTPDTIRFDDWS